MSNPNEASTAIHKLERSAFETALGFEIVGRIRKKYPGVTGREFAAALSFVTQKLAAEEGLDDFIYGMKEAAEQLTQN
jgi:hypothetical protein